MATQLLFVFAVQWYSHRSHDVSFAASKFSSNYAGIFNDREIESMLTYIYVWRKTEIEELNAIRVTLAKNIAIIDRDIKL